MEAIGVIGMIIAIVALIYLTFKGMNGFVASLAATVILIVTSGLPFWVVSEQIGELRQFGEF